MKHYQRNKHKKKKYNSTWKATSYKTILMSDKNPSALWLWTGKELEGRPELLAVATVSPASIITIMEKPKHFADPNNFNPDSNNFMEIPIRPASSERIQEMAFIYPEYRKIVASHKEKAEKLGYK